VLTFCRAAAALDPTDLTDLRWAARATLVSRKDDVAALDAAFDRYFAGGSPHTTDPEAPGPRAPRVRPQHSDGHEEETDVLSSAHWSSARPDEEPEGEAAIPLIASDVEVLRRKDFAELTLEEERQLAAMVRRLGLLIPLRASRRYRSASNGDRFDLRGTLRRSMRTEGEPLRRAWKERRTRRRPLVLLLDVSGSMAAYSRHLVEFGHAATRGGRRVEVFCFGTRLTRITRALRSRQPGEALAGVAEAVNDWEGGTRIGESLAQLLDEWSTRSALRGSVVVLCSDGLERGDPELLRRQMARLARLAWRVIWVNPLKGSPRYEPLARGMAASLPHVDVFLPGHNLESLEALGRAVAAT
jgi:uncharacterized protein with von Willebrand factor type A (vWA) domain